jgi:putative transposase
MGQRYQGARRCPRLRGYDYSTPGIYFITFCTAHRTHRLSRVVAGEIVLTHDGRCAAPAWRTLLRNLPEVRVLAGVMMPDHVHLLLQLRADISPRKSMSKIVGAMKACAAAAINRARSAPGSPVWQRSFYDSVVRTRSAIEDISRYIAENPLRWSARGV